MNFLNNKHFFSNEVIKKITKIPAVPGIYFFYDKTGKILYVGKAANLKNRVKSYFSLTQGFFSKKRKNISLRPIEQMIFEVADIKTQKTDSVLEALILEANLIKKFQPKYNMLGKYSKSFLYFVITKEKFPRVLITRKKELLEKAKIFYGPYMSRKQMEIAFKIMRKIFPLHIRKEKSEDNCLDFQIGLCPGPYVGAISPKDYQKNIYGIKMILEGKKMNLIKKFEKEMKRCAKFSDFEKAEEIKNKIFSLKYIRDTALISVEDLLFQISNNELPELLRIEAYDLSNIAGQHAVGSMVVFKNNQPDKSQYRKFRIKTIIGSNDVGMMEEILRRRFQNNWPKPDLILLDGGRGHINRGEKIMRELNLEIPIAAVTKGLTRKNIKIQILKRKEGLNFQYSENIKKILNNKNLIKQIMDEAHRFALQYHRKIRKENYFF